jgi:hypothetical protein
LKNYWGGSSGATTHLLDAMHYCGLLRVARREGGIRFYNAHQRGLGRTDAAARRARIEVLVAAPSAYTRRSTRRQRVGYLKARMGKDWGITPLAISAAVWRQLYFPVNDNYFSRPTTITFCLLRPPVRQLHF